jgi:hypothetical protein
MRENSLCPTLFHFEVRSGKCTTVTVVPDSSQKAARFILDGVESAEFAPPESVVTSNPMASG